MSKTKTIQPGTDFIDPNEIDNTQFQPRSHISEEGMEQLKESIALSNGNDQSVTLMIRESQLITLAGHRRVLACQELSLKVFSRIYEDMSDLEAWIKAGSSNIHEKVNTSDMIFLVTKLREMGLSQNQTMNELGLSKENTNFYDRIGRSVSDRLIYDYIDDRTLGISRAVQIAEFPKKNQVWYTKLAVSNNWNAKTMKSHATTWNLLNPSQRKQFKDGTGSWKTIEKEVKYKPLLDLIKLESSEIEATHKDHFTTTMDFIINYEANDAFIVNSGRKQILFWQEANFRGRRSEDVDTIEEQWITVKSEVVNLLTLLEHLEIGINKLDSINAAIKHYNLLYQDFAEKTKGSLSKSDNTELYKKMDKATQILCKLAKTELIVEFIQESLSSVIDFDAEFKIAAVAFQLQKEFDEQVTMETVPMEDRLGNFYSASIIPINDFHVASREIFLAQIKMGMLLFLDTKFPALAATNGYDGIKIIMTDEDIDEFNQLENIKEMYLFLRGIVFEAKMEYHAAKKKREAEIKEEIKDLKDKPTKVTIEYDPEVEAAVDEAIQEVDEEVRQDTEEVTEEVEVRQDTKEELNTCQTCGAKTETNFCNVCQHELPEQDPQSDFAIDDYVTYADGTVNWVGQVSGISDSELTVRRAQFNDWVTSPIDADDYIKVKINSLRSCDKCRSGTKVYGLDYDNHQLEFHADETPTEEKQIQPEVIGEVSEEDDIIRIDEHYLIDMIIIQEDLKHFEQNLAAKHLVGLQNIVEWVKTKGADFKEVAEGALKFGKKKFLLADQVNTHGRHKFFRSKVIELRSDEDKYNSAELGSQHIEFLLEIFPDVEKQEVVFVPHLKYGNQTWDGLPEFSELGLF